MFKQEEEERGVAAERLQGFVSGIDERQKMNKILKDRKYQEDICGKITRICIRNRTKKTNKRKIK